VVICFDSTKETKEKLDRLLKTSGCADYGEAISLAVDNALMLQKEVESDGSIVMEAVSTDHKKDLSQQRKAENETEKDPLEKPRNGKGRNEAKNVPSIFRMLRQTDSLHVADLPSDMWMGRQEIPLDRWIFGQYNKILPAKASCRALAALADSNDQEISFDDAIQHISEAAVELGDFLKGHDESNELKRGSALATAFPTSGDGQEKSRRRYANQFVAGTNKHGQLTGLLFDLKLINHADKAKSRLMLTQPGWEFAKLQNPVLDRAQEEPTQKFNEREQRLLLNHISLSVPMEDYAYRTILGIVSDGIDTPSEIDAELRDRAPISESKKGELSDSFLSSQRSGAVSRMEDLGLVDRVRNGIRISYAITEMGQQYPPSDN